MAKLSYKEYRDKALEKEEIQNVFSEHEEFFALRRELIRMRQEAGMTQEEIAQVIGTQKTSISRLESSNSKTLPSLGMLKKYAAATGHKLNISFLPV
ncbi:helix-turn-helix domain-containing protein [Sansalvadorimonas verongulae]|uniref:helix-turn-helix domain-containing protein n=1 Tax=Sansalvadorimonas verongulae TaxID=2172824 RepID=UPI0012BC6FE1|nr:helix-turn-helix transcriptional regulator [Sansalvadorimonas verongulae]MTI12016.1 XRE family transcriptional regulator [Sansalvadorimonas verongulae]